MKLWRSDSASFKLRPLGSSETITCVQDGGSPRVAGQPACVYFPDSLSLLGGGPLLAVSLLLFSRKRNIFSNQKPPLSVNLTGPNYSDYGN